MSDKATVIFLRLEAPAKPVPGAACNGCGVCCASATCPLARVLLWQWRAPCRALEWEGSRYVCGLMLRPEAYLGWLPRRLQAWARRLAARWIAAGTGCDSYASATPGEG